MLFFIIANIGYQAGVVFYDSFLPDITAPKNYGRVSGYGFAMGYLGSLITLAFVYPFIKANMIRETFPLSAVIFMIFAVPLFIFLKDNRKSITHSESFISIGFKRVINTLKHLKNYKNLSLFLLAFFFYVEGINTVIFFSGNYASSTLHFSFMQLIVFFLIVQTTAILGAVLFGVLADSYGQKKTIILSLFIWILTILIAYNTSGKNSPLVLFAAAKLNMDRDTVVRGFFYLVGLSAGSVMGGTQSVSRSLMSKLTPPDRKTEFFGFYSFFGKSSAILGPFVFGIVSYATGQQRLAILTIGIFFVVGLAILNYVNDPKTAELIKAGD